MKRKTLLGSLLTILLCLTLIAGSTFALFTDSETVDIAVTAGKVDVDATVTALSILSYPKLVEKDEWTEVNGNEATFTNGGVVTYAKESNNALTLDRITPGDAVKAEITIQNKSNVNVRYRLRYYAEADVTPEGKSPLLEALDITPADANGNKLVCNMKGYTKWSSTVIAPATTTEGDAVTTVSVTIELPYETGNEYQGTSCKIYLMVEAVQGNADVVWDGKADTTWYNDTDTEFVLNNASQFAGLADLVDAGNTFENKTIKLDADLDLGATDANGDPICFDPIGSYRNDQAFKGTFDGQGHSIVNMSQNTWALNNGYYYGDLGLGFFGKVEDATIKNLVMDGAEISGESGLCGTVAATAYGNCTFENIIVANSNVADYQYYAGGVVGWASGDHRYINCDVDASTTIAGQWGDFNNACGGLVGGAGSSGTYYFEDCDVACRIDAFNDVTSAYEWYSYRRCGMLIGDTNHTADGNAVTTAAAPNVTCVNCTVTYGEWANYTYCEFNAMGYPFVRVQAGVSTGAYSNPRYGHPTDANGNTVVDDNHVHNDGEKHHELIVFDQLFGGDSGDRYCTYGLATHPGVTVIYNNKPAN
ncbi:MAG: hypothetical protein E7624_01315 [Ruminococcaceae bacterium]|nr:hypothetical protein [Oscillospiraceae bacterium]